jgi:uncharacterized protein YutE (UPF0331/DUF86 family)
VVLRAEAIRERLLKLEQVVSRLQQLSALGDAALRDRLRGLGGFRNILVHGYLTLDANRVANVLSRAPSDFSDFIGAVRRWLSTAAPAWPRP